MARPNLSVVSAVEKSRLPKENDKDKDKSGKPRRKTSEELAALAKIDFSECKDNLDKLKQLQLLLENALPIAEGLYREAPTPSNSYALTNLIDKYQSVNEQIEEAVDRDRLLDECMVDVIRPFIDSLVLELGKLFKAELTGLKANGTAKKLVKTSFDEVFKRYGGCIGAHLPELKENLKEYL